MPNCIIISGHVRLFDHLVMYLLNPPRNREAKSLREGESEELRDFFALARKDENRFVWGPTLNREPGLWPGFS